MKNCKTQILCGQLAATFLVLFGCLLAPGPTFAQTHPKVAGELISAKETSLNGMAAISGLTVFSGSKLKTANAGAATVTVGRMGRLELGSGTEMVLSFAPNAVGGELLDGRAVLSVPAGVNLSIKTMEGKITTDGAQATVLSIDLSSQRARVVTYLGAAQVTSYGKTDKIANGEELVLQRQKSTSGWQRGRILAAGAGVVGAAGALGLASTAGHAAAATAASAATATTVATVASAAAVAVPSTPSLIGLVRSSVTTSLPSSTTNITRTGLSRNPQDFFRPVVTCRDRSSVTCRRRSFVGQ